MNFVSGASDFRTFRRPMVEAIISLPEYFRFSKGLFHGWDTIHIICRMRYMKEIAGHQNGHLNH